MRTRTYAAFAVAAVAASAMSMPVFAAEERGYLGLSVGKAQFPDACNDLNTLGVQGDCDDSDSALKIYGGSRIYENFAVEAFYSDFGSISAEGTTTDGDNATANAEVSGFGASAVGLLPLSRSIDLMAKLGMLYWDVESSSTVGGVSESNDDTGMDPTFGVGAQYTITSNVALRVEWERFDVGDSDTTGEDTIELMSVGMSAHF